MIEFFKLISFFMLILAGLIFIYLVIANPNDTRNFKNTTDN